jgi:response regulator RpfG family c-di-GMP phosphodiesterase
VEKAVLEDCDLSKASVYVIDKTAHGRRQTRNALNALGFSNIEDTVDIRHSDELLVERKVQLIVGNVQDGDDNLPALVRDIRHLREAGDPFIPIILNVWRPEEEVVKSIIASGADDLLVWPFSVEQLGRRVRTLIKCRKRFVATQSYFGPDRRDRRHWQDGARGVLVPNALRATALNDKSAMPDSQTIIKSMSAMLIEKIHYEAQDIDKYIIKVIPILAGKDPAVVNPGIIHVLRLLKSVRESITSLELDHLAELVDALENILRKMSSDVAGIDDRQCLLLSKTSRALALAANMDDSVGDMITGISAEIGRAEERKFFGAATG